MAGLRSLVIAALGLIALSGCKPSSSFAGSTNKTAKDKAPKADTGKSGSGSDPADGTHAGTKDDPIIIHAGTSKAATDVLPKGSKVLGCESEEAKIATCDPTTGSIKGVVPGEAVVKVHTPEGDKNIYVKVIPASTLGGTSGKGTGDPGITGTDSGKGTGVLGGLADSGSGLGSGQVDSGTLKGKPDPGGLLIDDGGRPCLDMILPLHIMIALDVTGSMDSNIDAIRDNIQQFAQVVKTIVPEGSKAPIPDVKIGAITYVDDVADQQMIGLTDPMSFANQMADLGTRGGIHDHCEGGIAATRAAMEALAAAQAATPGGTVPMVLVISDNYSHDSVNGEGSRTFDMAPVTGAAQAPQFKNMLFFDSVPTSGNVPLLLPCPGAPLGTAPAAQWQPVREAWKAVHPDVTVEPGRNIGFPFTGSTLLSTLPAELKRLLKVCAKAAP